MIIKNLLQKIGLNSDNCVVIGSGILQSLGIRQSKDIDVVVSGDIYDSLKNSDKFKATESHGQEILVDSIFEIGTNWEVLGKSYKFEDLKRESIIIDNIRYITLKFLYKVKQSWIKRDRNVRQKDVNDLELIESYLKKQGGDK